MDVILKILQRLHRMRHKPDLHSFKADIKGGVVYVEAQEEGLYMELFIYDAEGKETREHWTGSIVEGTKKLKDLGLALETIET